LLARRDKAISDLLKPIVLGLMGKEINRPKAPMAKNCQSVR
jgi:hypothetical protein